MSDGVKRVKKQLADGTVRVYEYPRAKEPRVRRKPPAAPGDTVGRVLDDYIASQRYKRLAANSQRLYDRAIREIRDAHGHDPISGVRRRTIRLMLEEFADKPTTHNTLLTVWRNVLDLAVEDELIDANPATRFEHLPTGERRTWSREQIDYALAHAPEWLRRAILVGLHTGQRAGDVVALRWDQYDGQVIRLTQQKTTTSLEIPVTPVLRRELEAWKKVRKTLTILSTVTGRPWRPNVFYTKVSLWLSEHPTMEGCTYHGLRHTAAAHLAEAGATPHEIQAVTGHRNLSTVARYTRGVDQRAAAEEAVRKLTKRRVTR